MLSCINNAIRSRDYSVTAIPDQSNTHTHNRPLGNICIAIIKSKAMSASGLIQVVLDDLVFHKFRFINRSFSCTKCLHNNKLLAFYHETKLERLFGFLKRCVVFKIFKFPCAFLTLYTFPFSHMIKS